MISCSSDGLFKELITKSHVFRDGKCVDVFPDDVKKDEKVYRDDPDCQNSGPNQEKYRLKVLEKYNTKLNSTHGKNIQFLVDAMGYPEKIVAPNGNNVFIFNVKRSYRTPLRVSTYRYGSWFRGTYSGSNSSTISGGEEITYWCKTYFEVNKKNIIIKWRSNNRSCMFP